MRTWIGIALAAGVLLAASGCGGGSDSGVGAKPTPSFADRSAASIRQAAYAAMQDVRSVRMIGNSGTGDQPATVDVVMNASGDCRGSVTIGLTSTELLAAGGHAWVRPDAAFWTTQMGEPFDSFAPLKGRWVVVPDGNEFGSLCDLDELLAGFSKKKASAKDSVDSGSLNGTEAVRLSTVKGGKTFTTWVAADEPHFVLQIDVSDAAGGALIHLDFSHFDEPLKVKAPARVVPLPGVGA